MNNTVKILAAFALGCAAGAAVTDILLKKKYSKQLEEAINKYDEEHNNTDIPVNTSNDDAKPAAPAENTDIFAQKTLEQTDYTEFLRKKFSEIDRNNFIHKKFLEIDRNNPYGVLTRDNAEDILVQEEHPMDDDEEPDEAAESKEMETVTEVINKAKAPKIIRADDFGEMPYLDKVELYYYREDGVLATENDEVIHDIQEVVGDCLRKYGFADNDESTLYVRNLRRGTDYEIIKIDGEFPGDSRY